MAARKKKPAKPAKVLTPKNRAGVLKVLVAAAREHGYVPMSRKLRVTSTTLLATLVGGLARKSSEALVLERFAKLLKRKAA